MRPEFTDARVSVIIPNRNNFDTLPAAIQSVGLQQMSAVEIIVIDDGSTDGSREWLAQMTREMPGLRVLHTESVGPADARNEGISIAYAPIICFLDADDLWHRGKLRFQVDFMERNPDIGFTFTDYVHVGPNGEDRGTCFDFWKSSARKPPPMHFFALEQAEATLLAQNIVGTSTVAVRKTLLQNANGFANSLRSAEDWDLWLRLASMGPVAASSMIAATYLMRPGSLTSRAEDRIAGIEDIASRYRSRNEPEIRQALRQVDARIARAKAELARSQADYLSAASNEMRALIAEPDRRVLRAVAGDILRNFGSRGDLNMQKPTIPQKEAGRL